MAMTQSRFFRSLVCCAVYLKGFHSDTYYGDYYPDWDECEVQIMRLVLSFFGAMGILDIAYQENATRFKHASDDKCIAISAFRITKLGAWVLGLCKTYEEATPVLTESQGSFMVQADYHITLSGLRLRIKHEPFLSAFMQKEVNDPNVSVYCVDFASIIRAYNQNNPIQPKDILAYLKEHCTHPIPDNVNRSFMDWQNKVNRITLHTVSVIQPDDPILLAELTHIKGMARFLGAEIQNAVQLKSQHDLPAVKKLIEKNGWIVTEKNRKG